MGKNFKIHFLNTVWSDAIILERNGHYAMIDTASAFYFPMIEEYFKTNNITELDFILLTHFHSDHYGNIINILNTIKVKKVYLKRYSAHEGTGGSGEIANEEYIAKEQSRFKAICETSIKNSKLIILDDFKEENITIKFQGQDIEIYDIINHLDVIYNDESSPYYHQNKFSENFNSISTFIKINNHNVYLGADMTNDPTEITELHRINTRVINSIYKLHNIDHMDIYKSSHHGGSGTNNLELCKLIKPSYTIITNTPRWLDNWSTEANLNEANPKVTILTTDFNQYVFDLSKKKITYKAIPSTSLFISLEKN